MRKPFYALIVALATAALLAVASATTMAAQPLDTYIVQLAERPAVAYEGGIAGLKATKPAPGSKIDPNAADVVKYVGYLKGRHDAVHGKVGGGAKIYDYTYSFNGFAAKLTGSQADEPRP